MQYDYQFHAIIIDMPIFFIFFLVITIISIIFSGMVVWNIVRMWSYRAFYRTIQPYRTLLKWSFFGILIAIPVIAVLSQLVVASSYSSIGSIIYILSMWTLGSMGYLLMGSFLAWAIAWILYMIRVVTGKKRFTWNRFIIPFSVDTRLSVRILITLPIIASIIVVAWGTVVANTTLRTVEYTISNQELSVPFPESWVGQKIGLISDTHIGPVRKQAFLEKVVMRMNREQPLFTIVAGDLIDGPLFPVRYLEPLTQLNAPLGNYFIPGNHEKYSPDSEIESIIGNYITLITDQVIIVDGVALLGIDDRKESSVAAFDRILTIIQDLPATTPIIGILHDPKNISALMNIAPNLTLSGHTHGGQMWPGNLLVRSLYGQFAYGFSQHNNGKTVHVTTSGAGTALVPIRLGTIPEIVIIHITE
jgi:predicted MPP superfamily phosphohydrolase